jgi:hypothetical protein
MILTGMGVEKKTEIVLPPALAAHGGLEWLPPSQQKEKEKM